MPAAYDGDPPWEFVLALSRDDAGADSEISGFLQRGAESLPLSAPLLVTTSGWVLFEHRVGRLRHFDAFAMLASLRADGNVTLPAADEEAFLARLYAQRTLPRLALPEDLSLEERAGTPAPHLKIGPPAPRTVAWARRVRSSDRGAVVSLRRVADRPRRPAERDRQRVGSPSDQAGS